LISFRYHLVSIVAVFLALAVGILMGTTVIKQGIIDQLNQQANRALRSSGALRQQVSQLQSEVAALNRFMTQAQPQLIAGKLAGREVVLVTMEGVDPSEVDGVRKALQQAGATVVAELVATSRMGVPDQKSESDLEAAIGATTSPSTPADLSAEAATVLAQRLAAGPDPSGPDVLRQLISGGFLALRPVANGDPTEIGSSIQADVVLSGGSAQPSVDPASFLVPLTAGLVAASQPVVAAEAQDPAYDFVSLIRADGALDKHLVTVDDADAVQGQVAVVLGLSALLVSPGNGGDYGVRDSASSILPPVPAPTP
jgi:hypothetical protein